jgi:hypothetical protein
MDGTFAWRIEIMSLKTLSNFTSRLLISVPLISNGLMAAGIDWIPKGALPEREAGEAVLCQRDFLTPEQADRIQSAALAAYPNEASWQAFAAHLKLKIQEQTGLSPWPEKSPLQTIQHSSRVYDGYAVSNIAIETLPGYWLTGNLYTPVGRESPFPAILHPHGHSGGPDAEHGWARHGRFKADVQLRAAALARMGAVCLTLDMFGYGDQQAFLGDHAHRSPLAMRIQLWNNIRAIDFLVGLPEVDPTRMGVTGHSGGATQAILLSALDARIAVSVPVAMVSSWFFGGCPCESGLPIHLSETHFANNAMIASLTAPRRQLLISDGGDWTRLTPTLEFPFIREAYGRMSAGSNVTYVHLPDDGHDYGFSKRRILYPYLASVLDLDLARIQNSDGVIDESVLTVEQPSQMRVFNAGHPVPDHALPDAESIANTLSSLQSFQ